MSEERRKVGSVAYREASPAYFAKRALKRHAAFWSLWSLGVAAVISGDQLGHEALQQPDIRAKVKEARITRTALVLVGRALAGESAAESRLYAADHHHLMRPRRA